MGIERRLLPCRISERYSQTIPNILLAATVYPWGLPL
jgi:hypothetical protein